MTRAVVVALTVAFAAAACAGGASPPPATIAAKAKDQLSVDAAVLQITDLPGAWNTNRPASTASDSLQARDDVLTVADVCMNTTDGITATTAREYLSGPTLGHVLVRGVVEAHQDESTISGKLTAFSAPAVSACVQQVVQNVFGGAAAIGDVAIAPSTADGVGDESGGFLVSVHLSSGGEEFFIGADMVALRVGRFRATCTVVNFDTPPDHGLCAAGLRATAHRLELPG